MNNATEAVGDFFSSIGEFFSGGDDFEGGGFSFVDDSGQASGDQGLARKGDANTEEVNMEGFKSGGAFGKKLKGSKSKASRAGTNVATKTTNAAREFNKGRKAMSKTHKKTMGVTEKVGKTIDKVGEVVNNMESDTTITITTSKVVELNDNGSGGTSVVSKETTRDTTVSKGQVNSVNNFVKQQNSSTQSQIDKILDNN